MQGQQSAYRWQEKSSTLTVSHPDSLPKKDFFSYLYRTYAQSLRRLIAQYRISDAAADDILQDTFVSAMRSIDSLTNQAAVLPWLRTIARNRCLMELRSNRRHLAIAHNDAISDDESQGDYEVVIAAPDIMTTYRLEYTLALIREIIKNHSNDTRRTIAELFYIEKKGVKEIGEALSLNSNTVLSHLRRFRIIITQAVLDIAEKEDLAAF